MCECLEYDDGSMYLCEVCAQEWKDVQGDLALLRGENEKMWKLLDEAVQWVCHGLVKWGDDTEPWLRKAREMVMSGLSRASKELEGEE